MSKRPSTALGDGEPDETDQVVNRSVLDQLLGAHTQRIIVATETSMGQRLRDYDKTA